MHLREDPTDADALVFDGAPAFAGVPVDELCALVMELQLTMVRLARCFIDMLFC